MFPTLKQGVIAGVFKIKGASPWAITKAEKILWKPRTKDADLFHSSSWAKDEVELPH